MCRLKNLHFTLRRACTHLDHLATHVHSTHTGNWPLGCWSLCVHARKNTFFPPLHSLTSRACTQFRGYLKNQRQTKTLPPPTPPPIQRGRAEKQCHRKRKSTWKREAVVWIQASTRLSKKGDAEERRWMKREWISQGRSPKTWIECMCLLSQLITLYRGHGLTLYTTHTIKWKGMRCQFQLQLISKVWMNLIRRSSKLNGLCRLVLSKFHEEKRGLA